jgi:hypothetical protein
MAFRRSPVRSRSGNCEPRDLSRRMIWIMRREEHAFTSGAAMRWTDGTHQTVEPFTIVTARSIAPSGRCRLQARIRAHTTSGASIPIDAPERATHRHESSRLAFKGALWMYSIVRNRNRIRFRSRVVVNCRCPSISDSGSNNSSGRNRVRRKALCWNRRKRTAFSSLREIRTENEDLVDQHSASWNPLISWLRGVTALRSAA